ncbi:MULTISPECIES: exonuclease domain-containing protein [Duncaniella]|uniref:Exonuclease n=1 Tax=Duncaniella dubosii TaxID=2518971 RepID=A0A4P7W431_9BACT|nr:MULTISPECIES: exonuclease domain-containing protein [Duncaniella]MBJ2190584.1 3'-5' exoribonuclease [Muribaculaceae bacterium]MCX4285331.1 exonuclease domain-containing protein [Duncaniella dubosii]QCD42190.1 exonuclease [Duncaniella dubosii]HBN63021.1 exonuclease [Porphyromonadaceae bacterium]
MLKLHSFTALDFETFTAERSSACAIGLVKVVAGHIVQKFYSMINPIPDHRDKDNSAVNGITREMVAVAPTFQELWPTIKKIIGNDVLVCHNAEFDSSVWDEQMNRYCCVTDPSKFRFFCTYQMTGLSLEDACAKHNIEMGCHHDALDDALACAKIMLAENGSMQTSTFKGGITAARAQMKAKKYERNTLDAIDDSLIENKDTPFFHARTVITGIFSAYPNRDELGKILQALGADINTSISRKTNIVIVGSGAGPSKLRKIEELRTDGFDIRVIYEPELLSILS